MTRCPIRVDDEQCALEPGHDPPCKVAEICEACGEVTCECCPGCTALAERVFALQEALADLEDRMFG